MLRSAFGTFLNVKSSQRLLFTSSSPRAEAVKDFTGQQDVVYTEPSILLDNNATDSVTRSALHDRIPVVVLIGWAGCRDSNLRKYQAIYQSLGYHTIRMSPSIQLVFMHRRRHKPLAYELLDTMRTKFPHNPSCVHMFSDTSLIVLYQHIISELRRADSAYSFFARNHRSLIVDSAFAWSDSPLFLFTAIAGLVRFNVVLPLPLRVLLGAALIVGANAYHAVNLGDHYFSRAIRAALDDPRLVPTLALLARNDKLLPFELMNEFHETRRARFPALRHKTIVFDDAEHVKIYAKHADEYVQHVREHLVACGIDLKTALGDLHESHSLS